ncbi:uncharacterized protein LOC129957504 [Argiope bruennichi]|uniref:uncharacterized protein LOC129957504 n=1 Tax=Argiope bruennichi TaxID=94029 RepID=UPI002494E3B2|nr:uncharacterized protein LOC129957504 [Argiope bruennichi]
MIFKIFGFLLLSIAGVRADSCNLAEFQKCVSQASDFADGYSFHITSPDEFQESCDTKTAAMDCVNDFVSRCMPGTQKEVFKATTGGKLKLVEELCTPGTDFNKGYLSNMDCWKRIANDISHCNANFEKSQMILMQEDMKERLRMFHSCCAYEWHKQCKAKAAESSCSEEAKDYVERVSTLLGGQILAQLCGSSSSDCYGQLYGVNHGAFFYPSAMITLLSFVLTSYF